jgi:CheY-like chemotaxis protein
MQVDTSSTRQYGGTGLGLAISKQLAEMMGGAIGVTSEEEKGSEFWFTVCMEKQPEGSRCDDVHRPAVAAVPRFERRDAHVLLVEDNPVNRSVALKMLDKLGLSADAAEDGEKALAALGKRAYDLVLMDCQMPRMDGYEATRRIRRMEGAVGMIPIIALTAHAMSGDRERCIEAGMDDYIAKPFSRDALMSVLEAWLPYSGEMDGARTANRRQETPAPSVAGLAHGDAGVWNRPDLLHRLLGDEEMTDEIASEFLGEIPRELSLLATALEAGDIAAVELRAHTIKGAAASVGGEALRSAAFGIEMTARSEDLATAAALMKSLEREFERLKKEMQPQDRSHAKPADS